MAVRTRLLVLTLLLLTFGLLATDVTAYVALRTHLVHRTDQTLTDTAGRLSRLDSATPTSLAVLERLAPRDLFVAMLDDRGHVLAATSPASSGRIWRADQLAALPAGRPATSAGRSGRDDDMRVLAVLLGRNGLTVPGLKAARRVRTVVVGLSMADDEESLRTLLVTGGAGWPGRAGDGGWCGVGAAARWAAADRAHRGDRTRHRAWGPPPADPPSR